MAYNYLLELYETIADRRREAREDGAAAPEHQQGRVDALDELEAFLRESYHGRLPRRVRARLDSPTPPAS